jgi:hypothetical protein
MMGLAVMDGGGFIRELCVALEYRWKADATFLLFIAFVDESDTHGPEPHMVMAAFWGSARQWELFERKIKALRRSYGFTTFHATEFRSGSGEFKGWSRTKGMRLVDDLANSIRDGLNEGVSVILPRKLYEVEYRARAPKHMPIDSQYGVCFRVCLHYLVNQITADAKTHKLHVVIEDGHPNILNTVKVFNEIKGDLKRRGIRVLGDITIAKKAERLPLMVADFYAHASYLSETRTRIGLPGYFEMAQELPRRGEAAASQLEITEETLAGLIEQWREARLERNKARRAARRVRQASFLLAASGGEQPC